MFRSRIVAAAIAISLFLVLNEATPAGAGWLRCRRPRCHVACPPCPVEYAPATLCHCSSTTGKWTAGKGNGMETEKMCTQNELGTKCAYPGCPEVVQP
jgi:hypothetical protein